MVMKMIMGLSRKLRSPELYAAELCFSPLRGNKQRVSTILTPYKGLSFVLARQVIASANVAPVGAKLHLGEPTKGATGTLGFVDVAVANLALAVVVVALGAVTREAALL